MARPLDYKWDEVWLKGDEWMAQEGEDFPVGEADYFQLWLQRRAHQEGLYADTRVIRLRGIGCMAVAFRLEAEDVESS